MKILIVTQYFLPQPLANAEVVGGLAHALSARGHDVHVVTHAPRADDRNVVVHHALGYFPADRASVPKRVVEYLLFSLGALISGARVRRPDVILVPSPPPTLGLVGALLSLLHRRPFVYVVQDLYPEVAAVAGGVAGSPAMRALKALMGLVYRRAGAVVVIDQQFVDVVGPAAGNTPVIAVRNAIDRSTFRGATPDPDYLTAVGVPEGSPVVMYAGNVGRSQDLELPIMATAGTGASFIVHGDGAGLAALRSFVEANGLDHVRFSPYRDRSELGRVYASADLHVVPLRSGVANASVPSKMLSIFSAERPAVVAAETGSPAATVLSEAGGGWLVPPGDLRAMTDAIGHALADPEERRRRGRAAFEWSEEGASLDRCAREYETIFRRVTQESA